MGTSQATILDLALDVGSEQRAAPRESFFQPVTITLTDGTKIEGFSRDLSETGIGLVHRQALPVAEVTVHFAPKGKPPRDVRTKICWCCATDDQWYLSGGQFLDVLE